MTCIILYKERDFISPDFCPLSFPPMGPTLLSGLRKSGKKEGEEERRSSGDIENDISYLPDSISIRRSVSPPLLSRFLLLSDLLFLRAPSKPSTVHPSSLLADLHGVPILMTYPQHT